MIPEISDQNGSYIGQCLPMTLEIAKPMKYGERFGEKGKKKQKRASCSFQIDSHAILEWTHAH